MNAPLSAAALYDRVAHVVPKAEWLSFENDIDAILRLKKEKNAVILAHNYQTPEIFHGVADIVGDSLALAREATKVEADVIVLAGVHFMAETAKLLNPEKTVLIPDLRAGCSLADSITPEDIALLRQAHPGVPVVTYVNTSAAVKAASDICCTSGNAKKVVESLGVPKVLMLPDEYLAKNIARETDVELIAWHGHCEVHELFTADDVREMREAFGDARPSTDALTDALFLGSCSICGNMTRAEGRKSTQNHAVIGGGVLRAPRCRPHRCFYYFFGRFERSRLGTSQPSFSATF